MIRPRRLTDTALGAALLIGAGYVGLHLLLDWVSWINSLGNLLITPWNPQAGLALSLYLLRGPRFFPVVALACFLADLMVRGENIDLVTSLNFAMGFSTVYALLAVLLKRYRMDLSLPGMRDFLLLAAGGALASLIVVAIHVGGLTALGFLAPANFPVAAVRYWVGDIIGILTVTPLFLVLWHQRIELRGLVREMALPLAVILVVSWIVFGLDVTDDFKFFYLLFLPLIWMAVRFGRRGAVIGIFATQVAMLTLTTSFHYAATTVTALQTLMLVLALTALLLSIAVDERGLAQAKLHEHQISLARMSRLSLAGEMASGLAHELNQPLSAIVNYIKAARGMLACQPAQQDEAQSALGKASSQAMRASQIVARLRDFLQRGELELEEISLAELVGESLALIAPTAKRARVRLLTDLAPDLPKVLVDRIHAEQVLLNLVVNAIEALEGKDVALAEVNIKASRQDDGQVMISVEDWGGGIDQSLAGRLFEPFASSKSEGMGLGLMICRTIAEAHGGRLWHDATIQDRTVFCFTLPAALPDQKGAMS